MKRKIGLLTRRRVAEFPVAPDNRRPHPHTSVGIEVEVEGVPIDPGFDSKRWMMVEEGSVINGCEFVSDPVFGTAIADSLAELDDIIIKYQPHVSHRTSTHIHINVLDMYPEDLVSMIKASLYYERTLYRLHSRWDRYNNVFCIPASECVVAQEAYSRVIKSLLEEKLVRYYTDSKYLGLNPNNIGTKGTLEYRQMGATTDTQEILNWIDILLRLKVSSQAGLPVDKPEEFWGPQFPLLTIDEPDLAEGKRVVETLGIWR